MNSLELRLQHLNGDLLNRLNQTASDVSSLLTKYDLNFPTYTDHSIKHTRQVFDLASQLLTQQEIDNLNAEEIYILSMACYLHDIGMCIPEDKIQEIKETDQYTTYISTVPGLDLENYIREIHHELSYKFIMTEWKYLGIVDEKFAKAIALVSMGHRKVDLNNLDEYPTKYFVKSGRDFICLPYITAVLRIADELDVTNIRTPQLLKKYYLPNNENSRKEWNKHIQTTQINFSEDYVSYEVKCSDHNMLAALETQFDKIQKTIHYCQRVIRTIGNTEDRRFGLKLMNVKPIYSYIDFDPKGIKFSFDVQNVTKTFIGEDLYEDPLSAIREAVQNSIDSCLYRRKLGNPEYSPSIIVRMENDRITIEDNGMGMDEFIIENFFGRLGSSFYEQLDVKNKFDAIGQFGVGVFSYFLITDFIEVNTKTEHGASLFFRVNNNPRSYFHFYEKGLRNSQGTSLILTINEAAKKYINFSAIEGYLKRYFRYIEFPIEVTGNHSSVQVLPRKYEIDVSQVLKEKISIARKDNIENLDIITVFIDNSQLTGICGLIIPKIDIGFKFNDALNHFDYDSFEIVRGRHNQSEIALSQKGVFINNYDGACLNGLVGSINLHEKERLNINRQEFINYDRISAIVSQFEMLLIEKLFNSINQKFSPSQRVKLTREFIEPYFNPRYLNESSDFIAILGKSFYVEVFNNDKTQYVDIDSFSRIYDSFIMIGDENKKKISQMYKLPVVVYRSNSRYHGGFDKLKIILSKFNYTSVAIPCDDLWYLKLNKVSNSNETAVTMDVFMLLDGEYFEIESAESDVLMFNLWAGKKKYSNSFRDSFVLNSNSLFFKRLFEFKDALINRPDYIRINKAIINLIYEYYTEDGDMDSMLIPKLNELVRPLSSIGCTYTFTKNDFWHWSR